MNTNNATRNAKKQKDYTCERCGKEHLGTFIYLELNNRTNHFATPGRVPEGESQGLFPFGKTCAYRALGHERFDDYCTENPGVAERMRMSLKRAMPARSAR